MDDLNDLVDPASGWTLTVAQSINDSGWIVGYGTNPAGQTHAFLLTPVPEPSVLTVLGSAALFCLRGMRRRDNAFTRSPASSA